MKIFIAVLIFIFSLQSWTKADDISEFEIEGMSIGDSALNFFSEKDIKYNSYDYYNDKEYTPVQMINEELYETYDSVDFDFKTGDLTYKIHALYGVKYYKGNINDCYEKMDQLVSQMSDVFKNSAEISKKDVEKNPKITGDPTGQTKVTRVSFWFSNGDRASVSCYDYSEELGNNDNLTIGLQTKEQNFFLTHKAYN